MTNFLKINKNIDSVVKYEAGISKIASNKKVIKLSTWFIVSSLYLSTSDKDKTIAL